VNDVRSQDLVLVVSEQSPDFDIAPYERFLEQLTHEGGDQQNEALHIAARYLLGGHYPDLFALAAENWDANERLREHYGHDRAAFVRSLELGSLLAGSIDHATATGKSFVIFGAAVLALCTGQVDRVLVLCPSKTIEEGLTRKFRDLVARPDLMDLLPKEARGRLPAITDAYEHSIPEGAICVENVHAAYDRSLSSIRDSLRGQGERTLIVNDEAHHIYQTSLGRGRDKKKWTEFLLDGDYGFRRVLNVSGTCFIGDVYFSDVIHRYGLQRARADKRIKDVYYWEAPTDFPDDVARWEAILANHEDNRTRYTGVKPITIFVTQKIAQASRLHEEFKYVLMAKAQISADEANDLCLIVSSAPEHAANLPVLRAVDAPDNKVEFIFSVAMLTEGWDVKNVLQIVPHEKRAFDSKLLISQVLGRGLRLLPRYRDARVVVFNHAKWAPEMRRLFDEVWYDEQRIRSSAIAGDPRHFEVHLLEVDRQTTSTATAAAPKGRAAGEKLVLLPQHAVTTTGQLVDLTGRGDERRYRYEEATESLDGIVGDIEAKLAAADLETSDDSAAEIGAIRAEIEAAMRAAKIPDDQLSFSNRARIDTWLTRLPKSGRRITVATINETLVSLSTAALVSQSVGRSELARDTAIAVRTDNGRAIRLPGHDTGQYDLLDQVIADPRRRHGAVIEIPNERAWRTPLDLVIVSFNPEQTFLRALFRRAEACAVEAWVKAPDAGFYGLPYTITRAGVVRNQTFNPDWFLRRGDDVLVVETKADGDVSAENRAKLRDATGWFGRLNSLLAAAAAPRRYYFYFLGLSDIEPFFDAVCDGSHPDFLSRIQSELAAEIEEAKATVPA
jgi:type III restriction enzyme